MQEERVLDFHSIEKKWQEEWKKGKIFEANPEGKKPKFFITFPYPYVNGAPHVGHSYSCFRTDVYARFKRMQGFNVLFPQGFHATGEPILGAVERLRKNEQAQIDNFKLSGATDAEIENFRKGPEEVAKFWMQRWIRDLNSAGVSIDWRRKFITTDLTPTYSRFIEWQYNTLRKKGYVVQGTHPVIYCPHCDSPTGDHDRLKGEGESPVEFTVLKFEIDVDGKKMFLPAATLRPETVFGAVNMWLNPDGIYAKASVDGEIWIIAKEAVEKLSNQQKKVKLIGDIAGRELIGKKCRNPVLNTEIPIYPASFVSLSNATGVVMSVPAHAPYDYIALEDLKKDEKTISEFKLDKKELLSIKALSLISTEGSGEFPAIEAVKRHGAKSQTDEAALEKATSEVYKHEFHMGILNSKCGKYSGLKVSECKKVLIDDFKQNKTADSFWECTNEVVCRCTTKCFVKILENQWFLKFSDEKWKEKVRSLVKKMTVYPEEARAQFLNTVDWLQNKACARRSGLGTKIPWDKTWIVETLSDSTIYMAYYTISRIINEEKITSEQLPDEVFDYLFLGIGSAEQLSNKTSLKKETIEKMKAEFDYFYPLDMRNSGKDLLQNHLTFFLFHHTAIFGENNLPKGVSVNGYVNVEGEKMSKSKGNFIPFSKLISEYGADVTRINITASGEGMDDADWRAETIRTYKRLLTFLYDTAENCAKGNSSSSSEYGRDEKLLESKFNSALLSTASDFECLRFRSACQSAIFKTTEALQGYISAKSSKGLKPNNAILKSCVEKAILMICPFVPHFSEEVWHLLGNKTFASLSPFPEAEKEKISIEFQQEEEYLRNTISDVRKTLELSRIEKPKKIALFVAEKWKNELFVSAISEAKKSGKLDIAVAIKSALSKPELKPKSSIIPAFFKSILKSVAYYSKEPLPEIDEMELLLQERALFEKNFGGNVSIFDASVVSNEQDPSGRAQRALPFKPAIYIE